jgi:hypothetical protein
MNNLGSKRSSAPSAIYFHLFDPFDNIVATIGGTGRGIMIWSPLWWGVQEVTGQIETDNFPTGTVSLSLKLAYILQDAPTKPLPRSHGLESVYRLRWDTDTQSGSPTLDAYDQSENCMGTIRQSRDGITITSTFLHRPSTHIVYLSIQQPNTCPSIQIELDDPLGIAWHFLREGAFEIETQPPATRCMAIQLLLKHARFNTECAKIPRGREWSGCFRGADARDAEQWVIETMRHVFPEDLATSAAIIHEHLLRRQAHPSAALY